MEAVVVETNGGATTSFGYEVHVITAGAKLPNASCGEQQKYSVAFLYGAVTDGNYGLSLQWLGPDRLSVAYHEAESAKLFRPQLIIGAHTVSVALKQNDNLPPDAGVYPPDAGLAPNQP